MKKKEAVDALRNAGHSEKNLLFMQDEKDDAEVDDRVFLSAMMDISDANTFEDIDIKNTLIAFEKKINNWFSLKKNQEINIEKELIKKVTDKLQSISDGHDDYVDGRTSIDQIVPDVFIKIDEILLMIADYYKS